MGTVPDFQSPNFQTAKSQVEFVAHGKLEHAVFRVVAIDHLGDTDVVAAVKHKVPALERDTDGNGEISTDAIRINLFIIYVIFLKQSDPNTEQQQIAVHFPIIITFQ